MNSNQQCLEANRQTELKSVLERLYNKYNHRSLIKPDPLQFLYRYSSPADMEIAALLSAQLAYGRVEQIQKSLSTLLALMGKSPCDFVLNFSELEQKKLALFKHRFTTGNDIADLLTILKNVLKKHGSLESFFLLGYNDTDDNIIPALSAFCDSLTAIYKKHHNDRLSHGLRYLLTNPSDGSACKRLNLFLRWMIRADDVDPGLWKSLDKAKLIVPIDVHMARLCKILGLYDHKTVSIKTAVQITNAFAEIEPADPVKYDFALSRVGIVENCTGQPRPECEICELLEFCK